MKKKNISQKALNNMIFESIKKALKEANGDPYRRTRVDFSKMPRKPKNMWYNGELQNIKKALEKGTFNGGENGVYNALLKMGYTQEEISQAYANGAIVKGGLDANNNYQFGKGTNNPTQYQPTGKLMTLEDFAYEAGINVNVQNLLGRWGLQPNSKTDANGWKQIFEKNTGLFKNNPGVMDRVRSYNPDFNPAERTGKEDFANGTTIGNSQGTETIAGDKKMSSDQLIELIQRNLGNTDKEVTITDVTEGSTAFLRSQGRNYVTRVIQQRMNQAKPTVIQQQGQDAWVKTENIITNWLNGQRMRGRDISAALSKIGTVLQTSRNEIPVVMGLQKALNYFGIKDSKGRNFAVDGAIGPETSNALKNAGFKDIYEWKQTIYNYQQKYNVPPAPDGKVGDNTIKSFQSNGISSLQQLNQFKPGRFETQEKLNSYGKVNTNVPKPNVTMTTQQTQPRIGNPGLMAESKKKMVKVNENTLNKLILESIKKNLNKK